MRLRKTGNDGKEGEGWQRREVSFGLRCVRVGIGFLPGSLLSANATMWIPFKSSSCGREESKLLSWVERYQGVSPGQTQRLEWKWEAVERGGRRGTHSGREYRWAAGKTVEFNHWVCKTGKQQPQTDISMKRASLLWAGGSKRAAAKGKMRENVSLVHQELREPQSILDTAPRVRVSVCVSRIHRQQI